jgi:hypothetical protein
MKLIDYINDSTLYDIIRIDNYSKLIDILVSTNKDFHRIAVSEDYLETNDICDIFSKYRDSVLLISCGDIDFPPPKKPYSYTKYFNESLLPKNYKEINYYLKVHTDILPIIEKNNLIVISHDVSVNEPRILNMPIGAYHKFNHQYLRGRTKSQLCYANFSIPWHSYWFGDVRLQIFNIIKDKDFIKFDNIKLSNCRSTDNCQHFYEQISISKFAICPRGCGIDTYRLWDCLYLGCIPIVEKYDGHKEFEDLPILFIDSIYDYKTLSSEYLESKYNEMLNTEYNFNKLNFSYWIKRIDMLYESIIKAEKHIVKDEKT